MWRSILGIIAGCLVGGIVAFLIEIPGIFIHPLPPGTNLSDPEALKSHMANAPLAALLGVAIAWMLAPFAAALVAGLIARRNFLVHAMVVGVFFLAMDMLNVVSFPHPNWLIVVGVVAPVVASLFGGSLAAQIIRHKSVSPRPYDMRERNMAC